MVSEGERAEDLVRVPQTTLDTMLTLPYNSDDALDLIRENADDLALVMVEAVQGSCPQKDHGGWHEALAATCRQCGVLLAFDETVCGFRLAFGGGHRHCLGAAFALAEMAIVLGKILPRFRFELASRTPLGIQRRNVTLAPEGGVAVTLRRR